MSLRDVCHEASWRNQAVDVFVCRSRVERNRARSHDSGWPRFTFEWRRPRARPIPARRRADL